MGQNKLFRLNLMPRYFELNFELTIGLYLDQVRPILVFPDINEGFRLKKFRKVNIISWHIFASS